MAHDGAQFPSGYRFCPRDHHLINDYLKNKVMNLPLPCDIIKDVVNLYDHNPQDLKEKFKISNDEKEWYFFTSRYDKYENGDPSNRASRCGYWKGTGTQQPITYKGNVIGYKTSLVFYENQPPQGIKTHHWIIDEYMLDKITSPGGVIEGRKRQKTNVADDNNKLDDDWVLCRIYESNNTQHYNDSNCNRMTLIAQLHI
ncbi:NAC domain-containing protein 67-like protein [Cinnamomum micranthum f. kanehirae]|uniref:NAC domain-containing protein 67-like protein n=1 Tax=Cinnamomum micranthum f. kanehirae TaxID=337451 RepID=A0A443NBG5_9MAGN|nr:NAC domain-containing protein 67-like protein [Cinnamomum micranthum f. kanehirae]